MNGFLAGIAKLLAGATKRQRARRRVEEITALREQAKALWDRRQDLLNTADTLAAKAGKQLATFRSQSATTSKVISRVAEDTAGSLKKRRRVGGGFTVAAAVAALAMIAYAIWSTVRSDKDVWQSDGKNTTN